MFFDKEDAMTYGPGILGNASHIFYVENTGQVWSV